MLIFDVWKIVFHSCIISQMAKLEFTSLKIGGQAGQGIKSAGLMFSKLATRSGYHIYSYTEYPSLIRGGHNVVTLRVSSREIFSLRQGINLLIALDKNTIDLHQDELLPNCVVIFDNEEFPLGKEDFKKPFILCPTTLGRIVKNGYGAGQKKWD